MVKEKIWGLVETILFLFCVVFGVCYITSSIIVTILLVLAAAVIRPTLNKNNSKRSMPRPVRLITAALLIASAIRMAPMQ